MEEPLQFLDRAGGPQRINFRQRLDPRTVAAAENEAVDLREGTPGRHDHLADSSRFQSADQIVERRLLLDEQQRISRGLGQWMKTGSCPSRENYRLHYLNL